MANALTYQSEFTGQQMDERFTAVATLTAALEALTGVVAQKYVKPSDGIPSTDMTAAVQASLAKAESAVQSLADYYTKTEVDQLLAAINGMDYVDVSTLPTASASTMGKIYLLGPDSSGYYAYYYTSYDGTSYSWVGPLGTTEISLSNYATKAELNQLDQKVNGLVIVDYTGAQGYVNLQDAIAEDTEAYITISGNTEDLKQIAFLNGWSSLLVVQPDNPTAFFTTIPTNTNKIGIYENPGTTLSLHLVITKVGIEQEIIKTNGKITALQTQTDGIVADLQGKVDDTILDESTEQVGEGVGASNFNTNQVYCPHKAISKSGYLSEIYFTAGANCTLTVYVGELDQRYLFIPRSSHSFACVAGENTINVASQKIAVYAGEFIAFMPSTGGVKFNNSTAGDPLAENSFLYSLNASNLFQLQVYGAAKIFKVNFYAKTTSDVFVQQTLESEKLQAQISTMVESVGSISSNIGIVTDAQGNKYRLKVVNGAVVPVLLDFRNVLCVGNSYTVHPTTDDTGSAFVTAYWWGHWAMAASSPDVAWTKLLQNSIRVNQNDAVVTPIFGRPYETGAVGLTDNDAFVYWESGTRKSLKANLESFSEVDCIVFFLGDNYTGNDWETKYNAMCEQFATWFPSASIYCVGAVISASVASAIQNVASTKGYPFIDVLSIKTQPLRNREGNFVLGDDNALHQINYSAVGNHFGDYGQFKLNEKIATALGATPVAVAYSVTLESQLLSLLQFNYLEDSIVSIFADASVNTISVVDSSNNAITATSHSTDYGKIFTFTMPASDVSVSVAS